MSDNILSNDAIKTLFNNLEKNEKLILAMYKENPEIHFSQEEIKTRGQLSTNDARVSLHKLEAVLFLQRNTKGRGNAYVLTENGKRIVTNIR